MECLPTMNPKGIPPHYVRDEDGTYAHPSLVRSWTESEISFLTSIFAKADTCINIESLANQMHRTYNSVALKISRLGLADRTRTKRPESVALSSLGVQKDWDSLSAEQKTKRLEHLTAGAFSGHKHTEENKKLTSIRIRKMIQEHGHNKGMLGKHHSEETKTKLSEVCSKLTVPVERQIRKLKTCLERYGAMHQMRRTSWKQGWRSIGGRRIYARSRWEANYARYLQFLKEHGQISEWEHEPETFWFDKVKRGTVSYLPDFRVTLHLGVVEYHEVKGWMDSKSKTKLKRMKKYFPNIKITIIDSTWFKANARKISGFISGWESNGNTDKLNPRAEEGVL